MLSAKLLIATTKVGKDDSKAGKSKTNNIPDVSCKKDAATDAPKAKSKDTKKSKKQLAAASNKVVVSPEEIMKEKIKRRKKEYFSILTKLQTDYPEYFSEELKPLAIGIHLELKNYITWAIS